MNAITKRTRTKFARGHRARGQGFLGLGIYQNPTDWMNLPSGKQTKNYEPLAIVVQYIVVVDTLVQWEDNGKMMGI